MIVDSIENASLYYGLNEDLEAAFIKMEACLKDGGDDAIYQINEFSTVGLQNGLKLRDRNCDYEYHNRYIDIHLCLKNREVIEYSARSISAVDSQPEKDFYLAKGEYAGEVVLKEGMFALFFTGELHKPQLGNPNETLTKCLTKIRVSR